MSVSVAEIWLQRRYGNTSSGSLWYALSYIEACQGVRKGEIVWQVRKVPLLEPAARLPASILRSQMVH